MRACVFGCVGKRVLASVCECVYVTDDDRETE